MRFIPAFLVLLGACDSGETPVTRLPPMPDLPAPSTAAPATPPRARWQGWLDSAALEACGFAAGTRLRLEAESEHGASWILEPARPPHGRLSVERHADDASAAAALAGRPGFRHPEHARVLLDEPAVLVFEEDFVPEGRVLRTLQMRAVQGIWLAELRLVEEGTAGESTAASAALRQRGTAVLSRLPTR